VRDLPAVRAIYAAMRADTAGGAMTRGGRDLITAACQAAGVELGAYDTRIVEWVAGFEAETSAVIAGLIERAAAAPHTVVLAAGQPDCFADMLADAVSYRELASQCGDCAVNPAGICWDCACDLDRIEAYRALARDLGIEAPR
jgi:hypothetical protein